MGCPITIKASYTTEVKDSETGKRLPHIRLDLVESKVRAKPGFWKSMQNMANPNQPLIKYGNDVAISCELDLSCGKRQFRFYFYGIDDNGNNAEAGYKPYPSGSDWIDLDTNKTISLGDLGKAL